MDNLGDHLDIDSVHPTRYDVDTSRKGLLELAEDDLRVGMTNGRKIARFFSRFKWYNPRSNVDISRSNPSESDHLLSISTRSDKTLPILDAAWAYFEHVTLPRRLLDEEGKEIYSATECIKAAPGDVMRPTKLYNPFTTSVSEIGDFGLGIGMYFYTLRAMTIVMMILSIIHIPNFLYFSSERYSKDSQSDVPFIIRGSAICTDTEWVPCLDCAPDVNNDVLTELWDISRVVSAPFNNSDRPMYFALKNACGDGYDSNVKPALVSLCGCIFVVVVFFVLGELQRRNQVELDERNATCTDFSVEIGNPPGDAVDIDEWKTFLESNVLAQIKKNPFGLGVDKAEPSARNAHITCLTVALDNQDLIDALVKRRVLKRKIEEFLGENEAIHIDKYYEEAMISRKEGTTMKSEDLQIILNSLIDLNAEIQERESKTYNACKVFATFETEVGQRAALTAFSIGQNDVNQNNIDAVDDKNLIFRGKYVIDAYEPSEPLTIRWNDLGIPLKTKVKKILISSLVSMSILIGSYNIIKHVFRKYGSRVALVIAVINMLTPHICRALTGFENHDVEGQKQVSLNFKVTAFRWINSAIAIHFVTPFAQNLANGEHLIKSVSAIFVAELWTAPLFQTLNIPGNIKRHFIAPRKKTLNEMKKCFSGGRWELAERYTSMTKIIFMCFFFSALFPGAFILSTFALIVHYEVDKFCLMRVWARAPSLGPQIAKINRSVVGPILVVTLAVMNAYLWSGFPYDNICESHNRVPDAYIGNYSFSSPAGEIKVVIQKNDELYHVCEQDVFDKSFSSSNEWLSEPQKNVVMILVWTAAVVFFLSIIFVLFYSDFSELIKDYFQAIYAPSGKIYGTDFSDIPGSIFPAYVPQVRMPAFAHPVVTCDLDGINKRFVGWRDQSCPDFSEHNIVYDVSDSVRKNTKKPVFSMMKQWEPPSRDL